MFHLLVKSNGWSQARDILSRERVFEYTETEIVEQFEHNGSLDSNRITGLPALFVSETSGTGSQLARVGDIIRMRETDSGLSLDYTFDSVLPPIHNSTLKKLATDLAIDSFEFTRTHWAIKDVDLFKVLFRNQAPARLAPKVFKLDDLEEVDDKLISVMMPFDIHFDKVYATIRSVIEDAGLRCLRADDIWENPSVIQDVVSLIHRAKAVICDCTLRNSNVFYEAGIAHTLG